MILSDGAIGQMMEKVELFEQIPRKTEAEIRAERDSWAAMGKLDSRERNIITSLELQSEKQEKHNHKLQAKYKAIEETEVRFEKLSCDDAEYLLVAYGLSARICQKVIEIGRAKGHKIGLLRPITLWPYPTKAVAEMASQVKGMLSVEMSAGQMVEDVRLAVNGKVAVEHFGRFGGMIPTPDEVLEALEEKIIKA